MNSGFDFLIYKAADEEVSVNAVIKDDTIWLTQKSMAELFEVTPQTITRHLADIYEEEELSRASTCTKIVQVQNEGNRQVKRNIDFYNLDAIISVGYRVNSKRATHFRQWATGVIKEYMIKGFALDDDRLKQGTNAFGKDYFRELLERVRSIRASERRIWQQITDIFAESSINEFLSFRRYDILPDNGKVSHKNALEKAYREYDEFNKSQRIISDFDRAIKRLDAKAEG